MTIESLYPAVDPYEFADDFPDLSERTLSHVWASRAAANGDAPFLWYSDRPVESWAEVARRVGTLAGGIAAQGVNRGDRVVLLMRNSPEMLAVLLALWRLGVVAVPLSSQMKGELLQGMIDRVDPALIVVDSELLAQIPDPVLEACAASGSLFVNRSDRDAGPDVGADLANLSEFRGEAPEAPVQPQDTALILFTSGSSGPSKGCILSHHYALYYGWVFWRYMGYTQDDNLYTCLPLNHCHALFASFWPAVLAGGRFSLSPRFSASEFWRQISESEATAHTAIGMMTSVLLARPEDEWESRNRVRVTHVSADGAMAMEKFEERFGYRTVSSLYGSTEAMVFPPLNLPPAPTLVGPRPKRWDVALVDEAGFPVAPGAAGELVLRPEMAYMMFDGYFGNAEATAKAFRGIWFHTGDLMRCDDEGRYWFVGRATDTIRRRGESISCFEIERTLARIPDADQVAAFPLPSEVSGEDIAVVVVRRPGSVLAPEAVVAYAGQELPKHMLPDRVWIWDDELPENASGKVDKVALRRRYGDSALGSG